MGEAKRRRNLDLPYRTSDTSTRARNSERVGKSHRVNAFGPSECGILWCLHCERTYAEFGYAELIDAIGEVMQMCPYDDCDGDAVIDAWDWSKILELHPEYPKIPEPGTGYPLYS
jgi:hypothetical protein